MPASWPGGPKEPAAKASALPLIAGAPDAVSRSGVYVNNVGGFRSGLARAKF